MSREGTQVSKVRATVLGAAQIIEAKTIRLLLPAAGNRLVPRHYNLAVLKLPTVYSVQYTVKYIIKPV
jgi:hypothetical protein